jgi:hypothetical protein
VLLGLTLENDAPFVPWAVTGAKGDSFWVFLMSSPTVIKDGRRAEP